MNNVKKIDPTETLSRKEMFDLLGISRSVYYSKLAKDPKFPKPIRIAAQNLRWFKLDLYEWMKNRERT